jgi:hypothetical protein
VISNGPDLPSGHELIDLEHEGWRALSTDGATAAAFYDRLLADRVLVVLPGGRVIDDRDEMVDAMRGPPWDRYELSRPKVLPIASDVATVAYEARAQRGRDTYAAWFTSIYVRENGVWKLAVHQQTPL